MNVLTHQLWDFSRLIGLRDRLRCPACRAVGTWKPHGGWLDRSDERKVRRWMCKWCGYYVGPEGERIVVVGPTCWAMPEDVDPMCTTPELACVEHFGRFVKPWHG